MSILRLGTHQLPAAEVVLVQMLVKLLARGDAFRWHFVAEPPYDALLVDGAADTAGMARAVLRITRSDTPETAGTLRRPIRADRLQDWLKATEHDLLTTDILNAADAEELDADHAPTPASTLRFKLRRWPPTAVLRGDLARIRMATLLSRRALGAAELAQLSARPPAEAQTFLHLLQTTGLVELHQEAPAPAAPAAPVAPRPSFGRGLIASIRRRLGVGGSAA